MLRRCCMALTYISHEQVVNLVRAKQSANNAATLTTQLIDVRSTAETARTGLIPTAVNIPLSILAEVLDYEADGHGDGGGGVDDADFEKTFGIARPRPGVSRLVFYCAHGVRSATAVEIAEQLGFTGAMNYSGSWAQWDYMMHHGGGENLKEEEDNSSSK